MSNWPPTCKGCGAPILGGRCPRCRTEDRPLGGKIVASGIPLGGFPGGVPEVPFVPDTADFVAKGVAGADAPTVTISDVPATAGYLLCAYVVVFSDGSVVPPDNTVTWGSTPMVDFGTSDGFLTNGFVITKQYLLPITALNQGTHSITVTNNDGQGTLRVYVLVFAMLGRTTVDAQGETESPVPDPGPMGAPLDTNTANTKVLFITFAENESEERGVYTPTGGSLEFSLEMTGGFTPGWFAMNVYDQGTSSPVNYEKTLLASRAWFTHALAFK